MQQHGLQSLVQCSKKRSNCKVAAHSIAFARLRDKLNKVYFFNRRSACTFARLRRLLHCHDALFVLPRSVILFNSSSFSMMHSQFVITANEFFPRLQFMHIMPLMKEGLMHTTDGSTVTNHVISQIRHLSKLFAKKVNNAISNHDMHQIRHFA